MNRLLVPAIAGPTASGKSAFAIECAQALGGEIVNVDSVQLFREGAIGSAKVTEQEFKGVRHHLLDLCSCDEQPNAAFVARAARRAVSEVRSRGSTPVIVAGTTLYVKALFEGLSELPPANRELREELDKLSTEELAAMLEGLDPRSAGRIDHSDRLRMIRAIEVIRSTGQQLSGLYERQPSDVAGFAGLFVVLCWRREFLRERIECRTRGMLQAGFVSEVRDIRDRFGEDAPILRAVGYRQCVDFLNGRIAESDLALRIIEHTSQLAKRQLTFWRNEPPKLGWNIRPGGEGVLLKSEPAIERARGSIKDFNVIRESRPELLKRLALRLREPSEVSEVWYVDAEFVLS